MPNPMTGDFEAVVQLAVRQLNGVLGTLHQNGLTSTTALKLLHNVHTRVGDSRRVPPDLGGFGDWANDFAAARSAGPKPPLRDSLVATAPPAVALRLQSAFGDFDHVFEPLPDLVRGSADVQLSTVHLDVPQGATSRVDIAVDIRARYTPDPQTTPLPAAIQGRVKAVFEVRHVVSAGVGRILIRPSTQAGDIQFTPGPGSSISSTDLKRITSQIRAMLINDFRLVPVDLPAGFPFSVFKGVGSGSTAAIALPLQLSGAPSVPGGAITLTQSIVGSHGFAFGVSAAHVLALVTPQIDGLKTQLAAQQFPVKGPQGLTFLYKLKFSLGPELVFQAGGIQISGRIAATSPPGSIAPNGSITFKVVVSLTVDAETQQVSVVRIGTTQASVSLKLKPFLSASKAAGLVNDQLDAALPAISSSIRPVFDQARTSFAKALQSFESSASALFFQSEVTVDGVILRGDIFTAFRFGPIIDFEQTPDGGFSAFESWIPGGWIDSYTWSWIEHPHPAVIFGQAKVLPPKTDTFVLPKPSATAEISRVCLQIRGERFLNDGQRQQVVAGTICKVDEPVIVIDAPSWWEAMMVPVWRPDIAPEARLSDAIVAHVSVQTDRPRRDPADTAIVFFPEWTSRAPFEALVRGLERAAGTSGTPAVMVILPEGAFATTRREFEARFAAFQAAGAVRLQVAEDIAGGWTRSFDVRQRPAVFLMNTRRQFVWSASGRLDPDKIAGALRQHGRPGIRRRFAPTRLHVAVGQPAPDVTFKDDHRDERALHRLRGRTVLATFWQSTSAPSLAELRRLQRLVDAQHRNPPFVVGFHGGAALKSFDAVRKEHGVRFPLVQDDEHRAARKFGVRCWPTTIEIDPEGVIAAVQLGVSSDREHPGY
jgi:peroxiredoxin